MIAAIGYGLGVKRAGQSGGSGLRRLEAGPGGMSGTPAGKLQLVGNGPPPALSGIRGMRREGNG